MDEYNEVHLGDDDDEVTFELLNSSENLLPSSEKRHKSSSPWTASCIARLFFLFIMLLVAIGFAISMMPHLESGNPGSEHHNNEETIYVKAAVAASIGECSEIGVDIMKIGGTAVDGAIASMLCQGVVEPHNSGLGGGFYMVYLNSSDGSSTVIDARESIPSDSSYKGQIATPGFLKGISHAYGKYGGGVEWAKLFEASIKLARDGYVVGDELARILHEKKQEIISSPALCHLYCADDGDDVKKSGDVASNVKLAETMTTISQQHGSDSFYSGEILDKIMHNLPTTTTTFPSVDDFNKYRAEELPTLQVDLPHAAAAVHHDDVITLHVTSAPSSGGPILAAIMSLVDGYAVNVTSYRAHPSLCWHRIVEAFKHAWGFGCDVIHGRADVTGYLSEASLREVRGRIVDNSTSQSTRYYSSSNTSSPMTSSPSSYGSHVSVLGSRGDAVSVTSSIGSRFGSLVVCNATGIIFNNALDSIKSLQGSHPLLSYMAPCIVANGNRSFFIIGSSGGTHAPTSTASALIRLLYMGYDDPDEAIKLPLLHNQLDPSLLFHEKDFDENILHELSELGHELHVMDRTSSHTNAVKNHISHIHAYSDVRNPDAQADGW